MDNKESILAGEKYINPFTDFGFKRLFGEIPNKNLLIDFLNQVLREQQAGTIKDLTYLKNEHLGTTAKDRKSVFDIYCTNDRGEKFIVELQKAEQKFFKDRALYYTTFPIREQAKRGEWSFELQAVYTIAILDFTFDQGRANKTKYRSDVQLIDRETHEVFYHKLTFIYFEMPKFKKNVEQLNSHYEKWLYLLRHLSELDDIPAEFQNDVFKQLFEVAEISKFSSEQVLLYEDSLKDYRDWKNILDMAVEKAVEKGLKQGLEQGLKQGMQKGIEKGIEQGMQKGLAKRNFEIVTNLLKINMSIPDISKATGLSEAEIEQIKQSQTNL